MTARFDGKVAIVTGASGVVGRAAALAFARQGATVLAAGRDEEKLAATVKEIEAGGGRAGAFAAT